MFATSQEKGAWAESLILELLQKMGHKVTPVPASGRLYGGGHGDIVLTTEKGKIIIDVKSGKSASRITKYGHVCVRVRIKAEGVFVWVPDKKLSKSREFYLYSRNVYVSGDWRNIYIEEKLLDRIEKAWEEGEPRRKMIERISQSGNPDFYNLANKALRPIEILE